MIGDVVVSEGIEFEVVWDGGEGLVADRQTKVGLEWKAPPRMYNKTGRHSKKNRIDNQDLEVQAVNPLDDLVVCGECGGLEVECSRLGHIGHRTVKVVAND